MATATHPGISSATLSIEEYLHTAYHPDCDFVDGHLEERNMGGTKHGLLQMQLGHWFVSHQQEWKVAIIGELRTRVGLTRVRLPDASVVRIDSALTEDLRVTPPLIAIEILSPDDRINRVITRLNDFLRMGAENIWLLDPIELVAYTYTSQGLKLSDTPRLQVPDSPIYLDLPQLFSSLSLTELQ